MPNTVKGVETDPIREKLIELLRECFDNGCYGFDEIADHLIAKGVTVQEWIPITERLPEDYATVLAYDGSSVEPCLYFSKRGFWTYDQYESDYISGVTHWRPLPEPPKGE